MKLQDFVSRLLGWFLLCSALSGCASTQARSSLADAHDWRQSSSALVADQLMAVAYSGYRRGQHPDLGEGERAPTDQQIVEDLELLVRHGFGLIRMYSAGDYTARTLALIREHQLPLKMLLGAWLQAEVSNHEGCPWLDEPIPDSELAANRLANQQELQRAVELARRYEDLVVAVNVGNEALVSWNDHMVTVEAVIEYVQQMKAAIPQPVTVAENYVWWRDQGQELAKVVDFVGVHTYPVWEGRAIEEGLDYTIANMNDVRRALPGKDMAILEAGWATTAIEFGQRANQAAQLRYYRELQSWAAEKNVSVFFFSAFDEPWKGHPESSAGAEKHWGLFDVDRQPKAVVSILR